LVKIHSDDTASEAAVSLAARAFTIGTDIFFRRGEYRPTEASGRSLLRHELAHVVQAAGGQQANGWQLPLSTPDDPSELEAHEASGTNAILPERIAQRTPGVRRVLAAFSTSHTEIQTTMNYTGGGSVSSVESSADAPRIRVALAALLASKKIEVAAVGDREFFSLPATGAATRTEVETAFTSAGFARPAVMADALVDRHNAHIFSGEEIFRAHGLWTIEVLRKRDTVKQTDRPLTSEEVTEAKLAFGPGLDYGSIRITEDPILGSMQIARTLPSRIYFPPGASKSANYTPWLIHELTHSWQYQHGVSVAQTGTTAFLCYAGVQTYDYGKQPGLTAAAAAGRRFTSFNTEQQGDIVRDYYRALKAGTSTAAWSPFLPEIQSP
jgi:hypothetical protein